jgi:choline-sulfatase
MRKKYWDIYRNADVPMPAVTIPYEAQDPHSQRILESCDFRRFDVTEANTRAARRAYFAAISYLDEKIGELLETLETCRFAENTVVVFTSDHGDMLGERSLWFKMNFFEPSARVPLMIAGPGLQSRSIAAPTSLLDILPTLVDLAGGAIPQAGLDGASLVPLASGASDPGRTVLAEYAAEGSIAPMVMLRKGRFKYVYSDPDPPLLFDLAADPHEMRNLGTDPSHAAAAQEFAAAVAARWDLAAFEADVLASQARRRLVYEALRSGSYFPWEFQPQRDASERYMRNHMDLNVLEATSRFPPPEKA